jgi:hypothetical protein
MLDLFEKKMLNKIFSLKKATVIGQFRIISEELLRLHRSAIVKY